DIADKARYSLAWCHIKLGTFDSAVTLLEQLSDNTAAPNRREAVKNLVDLLMNLRKFPEAISWMRKAAIILGGDEAIEMDYMRGLALSRMGEFPEALEAFRDFAKRHPKQVRSQEARYQASLMYITMGKFREALKELEPLLRREVLPEVREKAMYRTGECYLNLGNLKNARDSFDRVLREYPQGKARLDTLYQLGEVEYQSGNYAGALEAFRTLGAAGGEVSAQAQFRAGEVLMKAGRYTDAIKDFETYLANFGSAPLVDDARFKIGLCYLELKDQGKALAAFSQLRESKGYFRQEARFQIGEIARGLGNYPLAIQQYQAILAEEPKHPLASRTRRAIGICLHLAKDYPAAATMFLDILREYPATDVAVPESRFWLGKNLIAQGRVEDGILELLKVPVLYPKSPLVTEAYAEAARAYQSQGLTQRAEKMWRELLKVNNKGPLAEEARGHLKKP
ncbi:MAG TPA: tetratricopeptide repeat protein, partial [Candidatus Ozemobacteraceae bacterium]|nr:tetratricopeptide repeat protein [Candidatus Ozemobacteraceae bacterium]